MIRKCEYVPTLETKRLILRELDADDADDLQEWFCLKEMYIYWGTPAPKKGFQVAELFTDAMPWTPPLGDERRGMRLLAYASRRDRTRNPLASFF